MLKARPAATPVGPRQLPTYPPEFMTMSIFLATMVPSFLKPMRISMTDGGNGRPDINSSSLVNVIFTGLMAFLASKAAIGQMRAALFPNPPPTAQGIILMLSSDISRALAIAGRILNGACVTAQIVS